MFGNGSQPGLDLVQQNLAALEQAAEAGVGQGLRAPAQACIHQQVEHKGPQHHGGQVLVAHEGLAGIAFDRFEAGQVGLLHRLLGWVLEVAAIPPCPGRGRGDEQPLAVQQGQPGFPLGVGELGASSLQKLSQRQSRRQIGIALFDGNQRGSLGR